MICISNQLTDHLGSSTYITTLTGEVAQYAAYTPYGELFCEYCNVTPYKFNGKELDAETGLYYYGALNEIKNFISSQSGNNIKIIITNRIY